MKLFLALSIAIASTLGYNQTTNAQKLKSFGSNQLINENSMPIRNNNVRKDQKVENSHFRIGSTLKVKKPESNKKLPIKRNAFRTERLIAARTN